MLTSTKDSQENTEGTSHSQNNYHYNKELAGMVNYYLRYNILS